MEKLKDKGTKVFSNPLFITLIALLCCALWGSATPAIKIGYQLMLSPDKDVPSTILFAGIRFFFAGVLTVVIFSIARKKILYPKVENLGRVGIIAAIQTVLQYIFFYVGLANTSGVKGTILTGSSTFFAILIAALIFRQEKLNTKKIVACVLGLAGIIVINLNGLSLSMNFLGDAFCVFSAISLAFSSTLIKIFSKHEDPVTISGYQFIAGGAVMIIIGLAFGGKITVDSFKSVALLAYLALLSAVAYSLWGILLKYNPVSKVTVFSFTTPVFGVLLSMLLLTEKSGVDILNLIAALLLVALGIFILNADLAAIKNKLFKKRTETKTN
ncbi:MAG: DMT family transporter [Ruminococcaceae bacterium]|nr:DMT family transporter [Oscillospiraceae bacterium]